MRDGERNRRTIELGMHKRSTAARAFKWISTAVLLVSAADLVRRTRGGTYTAAIFDCGGGREIVLKREVFADPGPGGTYYEIRLNGSTTDGPSFIDVEDCDRWFAFATEGGSLIAVHSACDGSLLLLHDFATGESWPRPREGLGYSSGAFERRRQSAVDRYEAGWSTGRRIHSSFVFPQVPWCCLLPVALIATSCSWWADLGLAARIRALRRQHPDGHCRCGYDLTGNVTGRCPECGAEPCMEKVGGDGPT